MSSCRATNANRTRETVRAANDIAFGAALVWSAFVLVNGQHAGAPGTAKLRARRIAARKSARRANRAHAAALSARRAEARAFARAAFRTSALAEVFSEGAAERAGVKEGGA